MVNLLQETSGLSAVFRHFFDHYYTCSFLSNRRHFSCVTTLLGSIVSGLQQRADLGRLSHLIAAQDSGRASLALALALALASLLLGATDAIDCMQSMERGSVGDFEGNLDSDPFAASY